MSSNEPVTAAVFVDHGAREIYESVIAERKRQEVKHGRNDWTPFEWAGIATEELGEAMRHAIPMHFNGITIQDVLGFESEMIHVAATAIAAVESLHRGWHRLTGEDYSEASMRRYRLAENPHGGE